MSGKHTSVDLSDLALFAVDQADWNRLVQERERLWEAGNDLMDALLTAQPSVMYPRIVQDAMHAWLDAIGVARSDRPR